MGGGQILGFPIRDVVKAGVAVIAFPIVANQIRRVLPASLSSGSTGRWITNIGSAVAVGYVASKVMGPEAKRLALIALGANLLADAVAEFFPSISNLGMSYYPTGRQVGGGLRGFNTAGSRAIMSGAGVIGGGSAAGYPSGFTPNEGLRLVR